MQMKALSWDCATIPEKIQRTGWRDAGREGIGPKEDFLFYMEQNVTLQ